MPGIVCRFTKPLGTLQLFIVRNSQLYGVLQTTYLSLIYSLGTLSKYLWHSFFVKQKGQWEVRSAGCKKGVVSGHTQDNETIGGRRPLMRRGPGRSVASIVTILLFL